MDWGQGLYILGIVICALAIPCAIFAAYMYHWIAQDDRRHASDRDTEMHARIHGVSR